MTGLASTAQAFLKVLVRPRRSGCISIIARSKVFRHALQRDGADVPCERERAFTRVHDDELSEVEVPEWRSHRRRQRRVRRALELEADAMGETDDEQKCRRTKVVVTRDHRSSVTLKIEWQTHRIQRLQDRDAIRLFRHCFRVKAKNVVTNFALPQKMTECRVAISNNRSSTI